MTHTIKRWTIPVGVETGGVGSTGNTWHLNLTRSLAEVWADEPPRFRLQAADGRFLNFYCDRLVPSKDTAWVGTKAQVTSMRGSLPLAKQLSPVEVVHE